MFSILTPNRNSFQIFVSLEMIGHLGAAESLWRAVGRANSMTNVFVHPDSKLCFQPCLLPLPCKMDTAPATLDDSSPTIAIISQSLCPSTCIVPSIWMSLTNPYLSNLYWSLQISSNTTVLMILSLPMYVLQMTLYILCILQL